MVSDLRYAYRQLLKAPGFTFVAVLALALGIATATTNFTFYNALLVRPVPFLADQDSLIVLRTYSVKAPQDDFDSSVPDFRDLRSQSQTMSGALTLWNRTYILAGSERPERALGSWITADGFQTLGVQPLHGRLFHPDEAKAGAAPVVILSHSLWERAFGANLEILGQTIKLNRDQVTVVGIMPPGFAFPETTQLWQPFPDTEQAKEGERGAHGFPVFARMKPGVTLAQVQAELDTLGARLEQAYPDTNSGLRYRALTLRESYSRHEKLTMQLLLGATVAVLLIACGNVANLLLARAATRSRELAVRAALGASRGRLIRQLLTESLLLALCGGAAGWVLTFWQTDLVLSFIPVEIPFWLQFSPDWRVFLFTGVATLGSSVIFGVIPAFQTAQPELLQELKDGARGGTSSGRSHRIRHGLVVLQLALTLVLLVVAGLMVRSFLSLQNARTGVDISGVFTFRTGIPMNVESDEKVVARFFTDTERELRNLPGVEHAGFLSQLPVSNSSNYSNFSVEGRPEPKPGDRPSALIRSATPGVFKTLRIPLLRGRFFEETDRLENPAVGLVSDAFVRKFFTNENALGRRISVGGSERSPDRRWVEIVGIVGDVRQRAAQREEEPAIWLPLTQKGDRFMSAVMRVEGDPASYQRAAQDAVLAVRSDIPIYSPAPLAKVASDSLWAQRFFGGLFASFAGIALFLAAIGIYGVMAYSVSQRTQEIGVRMALGAQPGAVVAMVLRQGMLLVIAGLGLGFVGAWFAAQLLTTLLYGIEPHDPPTFAFVPLLLAVVGLVACYLPSRRATLVNPIAALRAD